MTRRLHLARNRQCFLLGLGWPGGWHGERHDRLYVYIGPLLLTVTLRREARR